jgi:hypothetical protein
VLILVRNARTFVRTDLAFVGRRRTHSPCRTGDSRNRLGAFPLPRERQPEAIRRVPPGARTTARSDLTTAPRALMASPCRPDDRGKRSDAFPLPHGRQGETVCHSADRVWK